MNSDKPWVDIPLPGLEMLPTISIQDSLFEAPLQIADKHLKAGSGLDIPERVKNRFTDRLVHIPDEYGGCLIWVGAISSDGYGRINFSVNGQQKTISTHKLALLLSGVNIPEGYVCEHECNNPLCCRVDNGHLRVVTQSENILRAVDDGRHIGPYTVIDSTSRRDRSLRIRDALRYGWDQKAYLNALLPHANNQQKLWE